VALEELILRFEWMWRISKTLTKADGTIVGMKDEVEDKLISGCKRMKAPTRAAPVSSKSSFGFPFLMPVPVFHTQLTLLL
jgi:hypothetical protein